MKRLAAILLTGALALTAADYPSAEISNQLIHAKVYLPDARNGFYKSTRFDWSGAIYSLQFAGHEFYGPWFTQSDPAVRDFIFKGADIVVSSASGITGPAEEFQNPLGYDAVKAGGNFVKVGVGVLRRTDDTAYGFSKPFDLVDPGKWTVRKGPDSITFTQELSDAATGYGYIYTKTVRLTANKAEMVLEHSLRNTGKLPIATNVYDHNFLVLDHLSPGPDYTITEPYEIKPSRAASADSLKINGNRAVYAKPVANEERVSFGLQGFGPDAKDYDVRIENRKAGVGMRITGDRPLADESVWSIRSVLAVEPFIDITVEPGKEFTWKYTYTYYKLP